MASGDLTDLIARVQDRGNLNPNDTGLTPAVLSRFVNASLKKIASEQDWPWLFAKATISTVAGTAEYSPPASWVRTDSLTDQGTGYMLQERQAPELDSYTGVTDRPVVYSLFADKIVLGPTPDAVYNLTHRYVRSENVLTVGSDSPLIPTAFDEGVVEWAAHLALRFARQPDRASEARQSYEDWLKDTQDIVRRGRRPLRVRVRPGSVI